MATPDVRVAIDGHLVDARSASVSVFDRGFLYGDSVFETVRTYGCAPFLLSAHMERLAWSAERVGLVLPWSAAELAQEVESVAAAVGRELPGELALRLMVTRGEGPLGLDPASATGPRRVLFAYALRPLPASWYTDGIAVVSWPTYRASDAARGAKVGNYLESILAVRHAHAAGAREALIVAHDGHLLEGTTSNLFALKGGALLTPPATDSILPGITRALVLDAAGALGLPAREERFDAQFLASCDEAFVTSTLRELLPIARIDGFSIGSGAGGPTTRRLHQEVRRRSGMSGPPPWDSGVGER